jgi:hypothetical protein
VSPQGKEKEIPFLKENVFSAEDPEISGLIEALREKERKTFIATRVRSIPISKKKGRKHYK